MARTSGSHRRDFEAFLATGNLCARPAPQTPRLGKAVLVRRAPAACCEPKEGVPPGLEGLVVGPLSFREMDPQEAMEGTPRFPVDLARALLPVEGKRLRRMPSPSEVPEPTGNVSVWPQALGLVPRAAEELAQAAHFLAVAPETQVDRGRTRSQPSDLLDCASPGLLIDCRHRQQAEPHRGTAKYACSSQPLEPEAGWLTLFPSSLSLLSLGKFPLLASVAPHCPIHGHEVVFSAPRVQNPRSSPSASAPKSL